MNRRQNLWMVIAVVHVIAASLNISDANYGWAMFSVGWIAISLFMASNDKDTDHA